jgi:molybdenum cofactor synthesis domain-containing protein
MKTNSVKVEIITIGDEILIGQIVDTNSAWMSVELNKAGFEIVQITSVHDDAAHIVASLDLALERADVVLFTGGIGPTKDDITKQTVGIVETKEKGGKVGDVLISLNTYQKLENYFVDNNTNTFKIKYQDYLDDIKNSCKKVNATYQGSHGFRWTFAQNRVREYQKHDYTFEQALQGVSWEMKHYRASITEHYLGNKIKKQN